MGLAIARSLLKEGVTATGLDLDSGRMALASAAGLEAASSVPDLAMHSDVILTSLPSDAALGAVVDELVGSVSNASGAIVVELSTLSLECKLRCRDQLLGKGIKMLDCPISGTGAQAQSGDLVVYASGEFSDYEGVASVLAKFSRSAPHVGQFGDGTRIKLVANLLVAIHNVATAEGAGFGCACGSGS